MVVCFREPVERVTSTFSTNFVAALKRHDSDLLPCVTEAPLMDKGSIWRCLSPGTVYPELNG